MDIPTGWIEGLLGLVGAGLIGWNTRIEKKTGDNAERLTLLERDLLRNYHSKDELRQVLNDVLGSVKDELSRLSRAVEKLSEDK